MNKHINTFIKSLSVVLAMIAFSWANPLRASHIIGAEIRYQCLGGNQYRIILDVYRDCFYGNEGFDAPVFLGAYRADGSFIMNLNVNFNPLFRDTLDNNISDDPCLLPPDDVCVEHARYEKTVVINEPGGIYLVYQRCCRNQTISNITMPEFTGSTYFTYISPESRALCNSSPEFDFYPPIFVCVNKEISHDHSANDSFNGENDSLVYRFYTPFTGATFAQPNPTTINYTPPPYDNDTVVWVAPLYNLDSLLGPSTIAELHIDPHTGLITGFPQIQGQFVVGVLVEEYRNGVLLSVTRRDFQYNVGECVEVKAKITANTAQCDDLTVTFGNETNGPENFSWYYIQGTDTVFFSNATEPTFTFPDTGKYEIMLVAVPGYDCVDTAYHPLFLQFNSLTTDFSWETFDCTDQSVLVLNDLSVDPVSPPVFWFWEITTQHGTYTSSAPDTVFVLPHPSVGTISLTVRTLNGCERTKTVDFQTGLNNPSDFLPDTIQICIGETTGLNPNGPTNGFAYQWAPPVPPNQQNLVNPIVTPPVPGTYLYRVAISVYNGLCIIQDTVVLIVHPDVVLDFEADTDCDAKVVHFINKSLNAPSGFVWDFGDPATTSDVSNLPAPTYIYPDYGTYLVTLMTSPEAVCRDTIQTPVVLQEKILDAAFDFDYVECEDGQVAIQFFDISTNNQFNTTGWLWEFSGVFNGTSTLPSPTIVVAQEGQLIVKLTITTDENCVDASEPDTLHIKLTFLPCLNDGEVLGCLEQGVILNPCGDDSYAYQWSPANGLSCTDCPSPFANPAQTTTYTVTVQNFSADTCFITRQVTVIVPEDVGLVATDDVLTCSPTATLTASTTLMPVTYQWFDQNGNLIAIGTNTLTVPVSGYATYIVRATDVPGCHYFDTIQVVGGPADIEAVGDQVICSDDPLSIFATNLDPNDTLTWLWTPSGAFVAGTETTANPELLIVPGNQTIHVLATNQFGCDTTTSVMLDILDVNNQLDFDFEIECNGSQVSFTNLSTNAYNFLWDFGDPTTTNDTSTETNPTYSYPYEGTFTATLTLGFDLDCFTPVQKEIIIDSTQFMVDFDLEYLDCSEDSVLIQFYDRTTFFVNNLSIDSFLWVLSNGLTSTEQNPVFHIPTGSDLGVMFTVWTSNGCEGMTEESVKFEFPNTVLPDTIVLCPGDSVFLNPAGNSTFTYRWSPDVAISSTTVVNPQVWPSQTTTYTVEVTSFVPDTCSIFKEITVFVPSEINLGIAGDTLTCGRPVTLNAVSPVAPLFYLWTANPPGGAISTGNSATHYPLVDTRYDLLATDQYGCTDTTSHFVVNEAIDADLTGPNGEVCPEDFIALVAVNNRGEHDLTYAWTATLPGEITAGANTATPTILTPSANDGATYTVVLENQFGCSDTLATTLEGFDFVPTVVASDTLCRDLPAPLNPGADPNHFYTWSPTTGFTAPVNPNAPNPMVSLSQTTNFTVIVSAGFGLENCADTIPVFRFVPPAIAITGAVDTFTCGSEITLVATTNVPTDIRWLSAAGTVLQNGNPFRPDPETEADFIATATDVFGCMEADTFTVVNNALAILLDGGGVIDTCPQPFYNLCINNLDPNDVLTYDWTAISNGQINSGADGPCANISTLPGETAVFSVTVSNQWGCTSTETANLTTYTFDPQIRELLTICPNVPTPINPGAAGSSLQYRWTPEIGLSCYDCPNPVATLAQSRLYQVTILGINSLDTCSFSGTVNVLVNPLIGISTNPSPDTSLCEMTALPLAASVVSPIVSEICWFENDLSNQIGCSDEITVTPNATVVYYAVANDTLGCRDTASLTVNAYPINVTLAEELIFCEEDEELDIVVVNNDPAQVLTFSNWQQQVYIVDASADSSRITVDDVPAVTLFTVEIENQFGCTLTDSTTVLYFNVDPTVGEITSTKDSIYFNSGEFSQLDLTFFEPGSLFEWVPQEGLSDPFIHDPTAAPDETTEYTLIISNEYGCSAARQVTITVLNPDCDEPNIFLPNAFTPNGDGHNDVLFVRSNIIAAMELSIYNRWGELVFRTNDQNTGWDGTYKNKPLAPDVFGVYLRADCFNGMTFVKKGNVMIAR